MTKPKNRHVRTRQHPEPPATCPCPHAARMLSRKPRRKPSFRVPNGQGTNEDSFDPDKTILVWRYEDAPATFQGLYDTGDGEWVALIPPLLSGTDVGWATEGGAFGCCAVKAFRFPTGYEVRIGVH